MHPSFIPLLVTPISAVSTALVSTAFSTFGEARRWNRSVPGTGERGPCFIPICFTGGTCSTPICSTLAAVTGRRPLTNVDFVAALARERAREEAENLAKLDIGASRTREASVSTSFNRSEVKIGQQEGHQYPLLLGFVGLRFLLGSGSAVSSREDRGTPMAAFDGRYWGFRPRRGPGFSSYHYDAPPLR